ncbi:MAG: LOG family protein [Legionellales bacterium]|nr:LOG family protein [Legionellales bacterium]
MFKDKRQTENSSDELGNDLLKDIENRYLELLQEFKTTEAGLEQAKIEKAIVFFGSARIRSEEKAKRRIQNLKKQLKNKPNCQELLQQYEIANNLSKNSLYLQEAVELSKLISTHSSTHTVFTGGGPGFMNAGNKGAYESNKPSVSLRISLPFKKERANLYNTPELTFYFNSFAVRKLHFLMRAKIIVIFPGGFGTLDELFEVLVLRQTGKIDKIPIIFFNKEFWNNTINFEYLISMGTINRKDIEDIFFVEKATQAWEIIKLIIK